MTIPPEDLTQAVDAIRKATSLTLLCHVTPDGDALGSTLAMHHLATAQGIPTTVSWPEPFAVPNIYAHLPGLGEATQARDITGEPDVVMTFDCGSLDRLAELGALAKSGTELIVVDHHLTNDRYGTINVIDVHAASTASVVRDLARSLGWPLGYDIALCLYTGLVTDTGRFQYSSTNQDVFELAAELASYGLPIAQISRILFEESSLAYLRLAGHALQTSVFDPDRSFLTTIVSLDDLREFGVTPDEVEAMIDLLRRAREAEVVAIAKEAAPGVVKVSMRSLRNIDVGAIAQSFGGGGHKLASGFTFEGSPTDALELVRKHLPLTK